MFDILVLILILNLISVQRLCSGVFLIRFVLEYIFLLGF